MYNLPNALVEIINSSAQNTIENSTLAMTTIHLQDYFSQPCLSCMVMALVTGFIAM